MSRPTSIKVQTLTRAEYILAKHIPNSNPAKISLPDEDKDYRIPSTSKPMENKTFERVVEEPELEYIAPEPEHKKKAGNDPLKRALEEIQRLQQVNSELAQDRDELATAYEKLASQSPIKRDLEKRNEGLLLERNYFENELKKAKADIIDLQNDLKHRDDALRNNPDYENQITKLNRDILDLKRQRDFDNAQLAQTINRLQDENNFLANDNTGLRNAKKNLEDKIDSLRQDLLKMDDATRGKMAEFDILARALDQEKKNNEALRQLLQLKTDDILKKETEKSSLLAEIAEMKAKATGGSNETELRQVLLMIEVERLQRLLAQKENSSSDKVLLENELAGLKSKIPDYEMRNQVLSEQLSKALRDLDDWKKRSGNDQYCNFDEGEERDKKSGRGEGSSPEKIAMDMKLRTLKLKVVEYENKTILLMIETERLGNILGELQQENEFWRATIQDLQRDVGVKDQENEELKNNLANLRDSLESEIRGQMDSRLREQERNYEDQIKKLRLDLNTAATQATIFKVDNEKLAKVVEDKKAEIEVLKNKLIMNQQENDQNIINLKNQFENVLKNRIEYEIRQANDSFRPVKENLETQNAILKNDNEALQNKLILLTGEIQRLSELNGQAKDEIAAWKRKLQENDYDHEREKIKLDSELKQKHEQQLIGEIKKYTNDVNNLEDQNWKLKVKSQDLEMQIVLFMVEIERLHGIIVEKEKENDFWKEQLSEERQEHENQIQELKKQFESLLMDRLDTERNEANVKFDIERKALDSVVNDLRARVRQLEENVNTVTSDNQKLTTIVTDRGAQIESLRQKTIQQQVQFNIEAENIKTHTEAAVRTEYENKINVMTDKFLADQRNLDEIIRQLRAKNGDLERDNQRLGHELEIATERIQDGEKKLVLLSQEINRLSDILMDKSREIEVLKSKYSDLERFSNIQLEELKLKHQNEMDSVIRDLNYKFQQERNEYDKQIRSLQQQIIELENKVALLSGECERLDHDVEQWRARSAAQEQQRVRDLETQKQQIEYEKKLELEKELAVTNAKANNEKQALESKIKEQRQKIMDMENKLTFAAVEIERLNTNYDDAKKEIEEWKAKCAELELSRQNDLEEMKNQVNAFRRSSISTSDKEIRFAAEKAAFEAEIMQNKQKIEELNSRIESLARENQKLSALASDRKREIDQLKLKFGDTNLSDQLEALRKENEDLKKNGLDSSQNRTKLDLERQRYETEINQLKQTIATDKLEQQKLYELINQRKNENEDIAKQLKDVRDELKRTTAAQKQAEADFSALTDKYDDLQRDAEEAQRGRDMYKNQLERNNTEFTEKNKDLLKKIQEVDELKKKYEDAIQNVDPLQSSKGYGRFSLKQDPF